MKTCPSESASDPRHDAGVPRGAVSRRTLLSGAAALLLHSLPRSVAGKGAVIPEQLWLEALIKELGLLAPGEKDVSTVESIRRLSSQKATEFTATHLVARTPSLKEERRVIPGGGAESWLVPGGGFAATAVFRVMIQRPSRQLLFFHAQGGPHLVSFGKHETRAIDRPQDDAARGAQTVQLRSGWIDVAISLAPGGGLERIRLHPEAASPIAPLDGWNPGRPLTYGAKAVTLVRLGGWEEELPISDAGPRTLSIVGGFDHEGRSVRRVSFEQPGVYTLVAKVSGTPPTAILLDDALLVARPGVPGFRPGPSRGGAIVNLGTLSISDLEHDITFHGSAGAVHQLMAVRRLSTEKHYLRVARAHGFESSKTDATASASSPVTYAALGRNVSALRAWLAGPFRQPAEPAEKTAPLPDVPAHPQPISPLFPTEPL